MLRYAQRRGIAMRCTAAHLVIGPVTIRHEDAKAKPELWASTAMTKLEEITFEQAEGRANRAAPGGMSFAFGEPAWMSPDFDARLHYDMNGPYSQDRSG
jgi:hypothetical protein